ncbi:hypothetical protein [Streptomyces sp. NBC_01431]|uniref:hypothetical protein n=1 Tax=Streptomyces sp. NBC_01431 TaxID=2903863 RepID=UPI002E36BB85|nr:hypothetical protein [Streptomyces sp. NBC_01431]
MLEEKLEALSRVTSEHMAMPFPPGFRRVDVEDRDMLILDVAAYGYEADVLNGAFPRTPTRRPHTAGDEVRHGATGNR